MANTEPTLYEKVAASLRITEAATPTAAELLRKADIQDAIDAAQQDLIRVGWPASAVADETNDRTIEAVKLYVKAYLDFQGKGTSYMENYRRYRNANMMDVVFLAATEESEA